MRNKIIFITLSLSAVIAFFVIFYFFGDFSKKNTREKSQQEVISGKKTAKKVDSISDCMKAKCKQNTIAQKNVDTLIKISERISATKDSTARDSIARTYLKGLKSSLNRSKNKQIKEKDFRVFGMGLSYCLLWVFYSILFVCVAVIIAFVVIRQIKRKPKINEPFFKVDSIEINDSLVDYFKL